jgi:hypothetical protein
VGLCIENAGIDMAAMNPANGFFSWIVASVALSAEQDS